MSDTIEDMLFLASDNSRARAYLDLLHLNNILPEAVIFLDVPNPIAKPTKRRQNDLFDNVTPILEKINQLSLPCEIVKTDNLNAAEVLLALEGHSASTVVFAGPTGSILKKQFFNLGKRYLHVHPGKLPEYRGSTPMYYSLLKDNAIWATAIFLQEAIDVGDIIAEKQFNVPKDKTTIDMFFDPYMRAELLVNVLNAYHKTGRFETTKQKSDAPPYYIIHPLLKHLAILR